MLQWKDIVIWNPYGDEKMGYKNFVCIENAVVKEVTVEAGEVSYFFVYLYRNTCVQKFICRKSV